jgi:uncharacterized protein (TIGR02001 family)
VVRGYSISANKPVGILNLSYDDPSGVYANGSVIGALDGGDSAVLQGLVGNVGYAYRVAPRLSVDAGVVRTQYYRLYGMSDHVGYTEGYVGGAFHNLSAHLYYSPDYFRSGTRTLYGEVEGSIETWAQIRLAAHLGYLDRLAQPAGTTSHNNQYDWRLSASRLFAPVNLHLSVSGGGPGADYYLRAAHSRTALIAGLSWAF